MDVPPLLPKRTGDWSLERYEAYWDERKRLENALVQEGLQYFSGGRIIPTGSLEDRAADSQGRERAVLAPRSIDEVLTRILNGLPRAMSPLTNRRKGLPTLAFDKEYDVQDLLHVLLRPWIKDIRPEEYTPSYGGKSTRMDFLLFEHETVLELKFIRDLAHGKSVGQELQIDIGHYRQHQKCKRLWCVVFDPNHFLGNSEGLNDLQGQHTQGSQTVDVKVLIL